MAQSVKHLTSAQFTISRFMGLSPVSVSMLTAWSLEPASDCVSLSLPLAHLHSLSLCLKNKNLKKKIISHKQSIIMKTKIIPKNQRPIKRNSINGLCENQIIFFLNTWQSIVVRQVTEEKTIFTNCITTKGLASRIC